MNSSTSPSSRRTRCSSTAAMARAARAGSRGAGDHAQDCAIESMRHSSLRGRAERRAVVEVGAPVPVAVPGLALRAPASAPPRARASAAARLRLAARFGERREFATASRAGTSRARRSRPCRRRRRGSCRRSSRRCPSAAGRGRRRSGCGRARARSARRACRAPPRRAAAKYDSRWPAASGGPRGRERPRRGWRASPVTST